MLKNVHFNVAQIFSKKQLQWGPQIFRLVVGQYWLFKSISSILSKFTHQYSIFGKVLADKTENLTHKSRINSDKAWRVDNS